MATENLTDMEIIQQCLDGDKEIFRLLISRYKGLVYSIITKMVSSPDIYEDLAQEIFIKIYKNLDKYTDQYKFSTWIIRIATNHIIDYRRKKKIEYVPFEATEYSLSTYISAEDEVVKSEKIQAVEKIINQLPEIYRLPIVLYHNQGLSYDEISKSLNQPLSKVKNRIFRGRKMIRQEYEKFNSN